MDEQKLSPLGQEILAWMRRQGLSLSSAAQHCHISPAGLKKNMQSGHQAGHQTLQKIAQGMGMAIERVEALARGQGTDDPDDMVMIPQYGVEASAGRGGLLDTEDVEGILALNRGLVRSALHAQPEYLSALYVRGDSMEPMLRAGDVAVIDHSQAKERTDGVYVLRLDGTLLIKSLQWLPGGKLRVKSENPAYEPYQIDPRQEEIQIIGRVVWAGRKF